MELSDNQKKKAWLILGGVTAMLVVLLLAQGFRAFIGVRVASIPDLSERVIGGQLASDVLQEGANTLEFTARTNDGRIISDTVTFEVLPPDPYSPYDPYDPYEPELPPDPLDPY